MNEKFVSTLNLKIYFGCNQKDKKVVERKIKEAIIRSMEGEEGIFTGSFLKQLLPWKGEFFKVNKIEEMKK